jgi:hypothetical protein
MRLRSSQGYFSYGASPLHTAFSSSSLGITPLIKCDYIYSAIAMPLLISLLYFLRSDFAFAAPIRNLTALRTDIAPAWVANPSGRGTWDLLYSCTFTIFLCVYTAIHLNAPPEESGFRFWLRKTKWVCIAIIAPEVVVYTSFEQWILSRGFLKDLRKIIDDSTDEKYKVRAMLCLSIFYSNILIGLGKKLQPEMLF